MWCANCRAEVAAEIAEDDRRIRCARCAADLGAARSHSPEQNARELLERWTKAPLPEIPPALASAPHQPAPGAAASSRAETPDNQKHVEMAAAPRPELRPAPAAAAMELDRPTETASAQQASNVERAEPVIPAERSMTRIDAAHPPRNGNGERLAAQRYEKLGIENESPRDERRHSADSEYRRGREYDHLDRFDEGDRLDERENGHDRDAHRQQTNGHVTRERRPSKSPATNWQSLLGQCLAYVGVGGLTLGTSLAVWSYYGGPANYAGTGWLIMTAGQMLLFLGVITLVSGGMDQSTQEMTRRFDELAERMIRIEAGSPRHGMQGPHSPAAGYSRDRAAPGTRRGLRDGDGEALSARG